jgi:multidrug efflux pump subunit AcrB
MKQRRGPIAWMAQNTVAANLLMGVFIVGGLLISGSVKQEVFPEFTVDEIHVSSVYPGASPSEVEKGVLIAMEEAVRGLARWRELRTRSGPSRNRFRQRASAFRYSRCH